MDFLIISDDVVIFSEQLDGGGSIEAVRIRKLSRSRKL